MEDDEQGAGEGEGEEEQQADVLVDILSGDERKPTEKEYIVQRMIQVLAAEYHFPLESMGRDMAIAVQVNGKRRTKVADLVVFGSEGAHSLDNAARLVVVQAPGTKPTDQNRGVELLKDLLDSVDACDFGVWTNGRDIAYFRKEPGPIQSTFIELSDFPGNGETLEDLDRPDRRIARVAVAEDLRDTILRCHDYLYGNQSMTAPRAFSELVKLIFCKIYDEQRLRKSTAYRRQFWVGVTERHWAEHPYTGVRQLAVRPSKAVAERGDERNRLDGPNEVERRIKNLFEQVKEDPELEGVFKPGDEIELQPRPLTWIAGELARYNLLDADVDVKGMAYEAMVATTMKRERGQFFTPRNVVEAMVEMLAPRPGERVLDPACGSGRFLVACLERFRRLRAEDMGPATPGEMRRRRNSGPVLADASDYAQECLFGVDVDPELQRAAKMNMLLNNDGHGNLFVANSLEISPVTIAERRFAGAGQLEFGSFDVVLTNPPFGAKIPVDDPDVLRGFELAHQWQKTEAGTWVMQQSPLRAKVPPEILFIERCLQFLKEGGRMGIVVPDGILGNPGNEYIRAWILQQARVLASIDLPVEAFLPQVGVQASLLFLEKKTRQEINAGGEADYPIFMAVAEFVGHDRRGNQIFRRDPDGFELFEPDVIDLIVLRGGKEVSESRQLRRKVVADDLPDIARAYREWKEQGVIHSVA